MPDTSLEVVTTAIEIKDAAISQAGFGTPLIAGHLDATLTTAWITAYGNVRTAVFSSLDGLVDDLAMSTSHPIYRAASKVMSQKPAPEQFMVGRRLGAVTHTVRLTPATPAQGDIYALEVDGEAVSVTAGVAPTVASICAALTTTIDALAANVDATDVVTHVDVAGLTAGELHRFEGLTANLGIKDVTANPATTIQTDLAAIRAESSDWYGLLLDSNGEAEVLAAAAWAETQRILLLVTTMDSEVKDSAVTTDVASDLELALYNRTAILFHTKPHSQYAAAAWMGRMLPKAPGSATWANKSLAGVDKVALSDTARANLKAKTCNYYVDIKGLGFTLDGRAASGRYLDITHGMDWFEVRVQERIIALLANNDKIPYTDKGAELVRAQVVGQVLEAIAAGVADGDLPWSVTVPKVSAVNPNDKAARLLPDVKFDFVLAGAIHKVQIRGTVRISL